MAESTGFEPVCALAQPSLSKRVQYRSANSPKWRRAQDSNLHVLEDACFRDRGDTNSATTLRVNDYRDRDERLVDRLLEGLKRVIGRMSIRSRGGIRTRVSVGIGASAHPRVITALAISLSATRPRIERFGF